MSTQGPAQHDGVEKCKIGLMRSLKKKKQRAKSKQKGEVVGSFLVVM